MAFSSGHWSDLDWVDRANSFWSVLLLSVLSVAVFLLRFIIDPFVCWTPAEWTDSHMSYGEQYASMLSKLHLPGTQYSTQSQHLAAPLILFFQALGFVAPYFLWRVARPLLAPPLPILDAQTAANQAPHAARLLLATLRRSRSRLTMGYLAVKGLACLNLLIQFIALTVFFYSRLNILGSADVSVTRFPTLVMATISTRVLDRDKEWSLQCLSSMNDALLRLFAFLWYWILFLGCLTVAHTLLTAASLFQPALRDQRLEILLDAGEEGGPSPGDVSNWVGGTLGTDGVLLLTQVSACQGPVLGSLLAREMWRLGYVPSPPPTGEHGIPLTVFPGSAEGQDADAGMEKVPL